MPETAVHERIAIKDSGVPHRESEDRKIKPSARRLVERIRKGRVAGDPDNVFGEIAQTEHERPQRHKDTSRRKLQEPQSHQQESENAALNAKVSAFFEKNPPPDASEITEEQQQLRSQEAMMTCRALIEAHISEEDPYSHGSRAALKEVVDAFGQRYQFTDQQKEITKDLVDAYYDHRKRAREIWEKYGHDKRALVHRLTGMDLPNKAKVDAQLGAWGIEIVADNDITNYVLYRGKTPPTDFVAGALADTAQVPPYILLNRGKYDNPTLHHEQQHVRYALGKNVLERHNVDVVGNEPFGEIPMPSSREQIEQQFRRDRKDAFDQAKDEVFAYSFNAKHFPIEHFIARDGNPYDYLKSAREWGAAQRDPAYREASQKVLVSEYNATLSAAAASFELLMKKGGYSNTEVIALLTDTPLEQWSTTAGRIFDTREITLSAKEIAAISMPEEQVAKSTRVREPEELGGADNIRYEKVGERSVPILDVVITEQERWPNWYEERLRMGEVNHPKPEQPTAESDEEQVPEDARSFTIINKLLYDRTRSQVDFLNKIYGGKELKEYFSILDKVTAEKTNSFLRDGTVHEQDIQIAEKIILVRLEELYRKSH